MAKPKTKARAAAWYYPMSIQIKVGPRETGSQVEPKPSDGAEIFDKYNLHIITI